MGVFVSQTPICQEGFRSTEFVRHLWSMPNMGKLLIFCKFSLFRGSKKRVFSTKDFQTSRSSLWALYVHYIDVVAFSLGWTLKWCTKRGWIFFKNFRHLYRAMAIIRKEQNPKPERYSMITERISKIWGFETLLPSRTWIRIPKFWPENL